MLAAALAQFALCYLCSLLFVFMFSTVIPTLRGEAEGEGEREKSGILKTEPFFLFSLQSRER